MINDNILPVNGNIKNEFYPDILSIGESKMQNRITDKDLQNLVNKINQKTNSPLEAYTKTESGYKSNVGCYVIDGAYGGVKLERICTDGGGVSSISYGGFVTKRELYNWMYAFLCGLDAK